MLPSLEAPEIFFGICAPVGTDNQRVVELIKQTLLPFSYPVTYFKVTTIMKEIGISGLSLKTKPVEDRYDSYINYANKIRELTGYPSALAMMCCGAVRNHRRETAGDPSAWTPNKAYIFDQFKRKEEVEALRQVYGRLFILVSVYSDKEKRTVRLAEQIARDHASARPTLEHENDARKLVFRDEEEKEIPAGQGLRDTFPLADVFINIDDMDGAKKILNRFIGLFFGANNISPTKDEYGMYIAKSAALRSLDLSRQVGAAIFSDKGEVISLGCNEVPKPGGGTYWSDDKHDARDYVLQRDENDRIKKSLLADVVQRLADANIFSTNHSKD